MSSKKGVKEIKSPVPKLSLIVVAADGHGVTMRCIESIRDTTTNTYEIVVIDNYSNDGTDVLLKAQKDIVYVRSNQNIGYGEAVNLGVKNANPKSKYIGVLNNDIVLTNGWDQKFIDCFEHPENISEGVDRVGIVGPTTNYAAGIQMLTSMKNYDASKAEETNTYMVREAKKSKRKYVRTMFLSGFCMFISRECWNDVGEFESFGRYKFGYEDNDYCLRANIEHGYGTIVCCDTFVHHEGSYSISLYSATHLKGGTAGKDDFLKKWNKKLYKENPKLVAGYRAKIENDFLFDVFKKALTKMSEVADEIVIFDDGSNEKTLKMYSEFPKIVNVHKQTEPTFKEDRDRDKLIQLCKERNPDWFIITDADDILEPKFTREEAVKLMNPVNPHTIEYVFKFVQIWDYPDKQRQDGVFGRFAGIRMVRCMPDNQHIIKTDHPQGFHCNSVPMYTGMGVSNTHYRIIHLGYFTKEERKRKYDFYQEKDTAKDPIMIGGADYRHLISPKVSLIDYNPNTSISVCMLVYEADAKFAIEFMHEYNTWFNEFVIVDTGCSEDTLEKLKFYGCKIIKHTWSEDYSSARNAGFAQCTSTHILHMDPDERFSDYLKKDPFILMRMAEEPYIAHFLKIRNLTPDKKPFFQDNIRLFKNNIGIKYSGAVHESPLESLKGIVDSGKGFVAPFVDDERKPNEIDHYGYMKPPKEVQKKLEKYTSICNKNLALNPNDGLSHFSLAMHYQNESNKTRDQKERAEFINKSEYHFKLARMHAPMIPDTWIESVNFKGREFMEMIMLAINNLPEGSKPWMFLNELGDAVSHFIAPLGIVGIPKRGEQYFKNG